MQGMFLPWQPRGAHVFIAVGLVEGWGIVVEGRYGFRSEFMKVVAMVAPPDFRGSADPLITEATQRLAHTRRIPLITPREADARIERRRSGTSDSSVRS